MQGPPLFSDDFSDAQLARFYEIVPGVGEIARNVGGLHCRITPGLDGPASAEDELTIDSLGRPQSPTTQAVLRFSGDEWTLEVLIEYDFEAKRNGRHAYVWLVPGDPSERTRESVAIVRSADPERESHGLNILAYQTSEDPRSVAITATPGQRYWFRVSRAQGRVTVAWSSDGTTFTTALETAAGPPRRLHSMLVNSSSFAGGAAFVLRALRLFGGRPHEAPPQRLVFTGNGAPDGEVTADQLAGALTAGHDIKLQDCAVSGGLEFSNIGMPIRSQMQFQNCTFAGPVLGSDRVRIEGALSWEGCEFQRVGLSSVEFGRGVRFVNCQFRSDTRFIGAQFRRGANFTGSTFAEKPLFRVARVIGGLSLYHTSFAHGPDLSSAVVEGDLSLSDVAVQTGSLTLHQSHVAGTVRLMTTLQREPQSLGSEVDFSRTSLGALVISAGDRRNESEQTGPARWDFPAYVSLHRAVIDRFEAFRVHFAKPFDLSKSTLRSIGLEQATFEQPIGEWPVDTEFYSCFISYSSHDHDFATHLRTALERNGVGCWFAPENMKIGDSIPQRIKEEIHRHDKLLLILSKHSLESDWVRQEVEVCLERERQQRRQVLLPIQLDDRFEGSAPGWATPILHERHIGDFRTGFDDETNMEAFARLLRDLKAPRQRAATQIERTAE